MRKQIYFRGAVRLALCTAAVILVCGGCSGGKSKETASLVPEITSVTETPSPSPSPEPELLIDIDKNKRIGVLTGEFIDEQAAARRPFAVVINNLRKALPQSGIAQAGIIYEVLAEGDITRLVAIFQDFDSEKIGPVRSTRDYFTDFAQNHDALFIHHGGSDSGYIKMKKQKLDHLDGQFDSLAFWRDEKRMSMAGMYEHSSYTNAEKMIAESERQGMRTTILEDYGSGFGFYPIAALPPSSEPATKITVPFSKNYTSIFEYDAASKLYKVFMGESEHVDEEAGKQLEVTNVLVQLTKMRIIAGDDAGRRDVDTVGEGAGYLFTSGEYVEVTWEKKSHAEPMQWFDEEGNILKLNKGKTWICVYNGEVGIE